MKGLIKEKLVNHHAKCGVDRYGQMSALDFYQIFGREDGAKVFNYVCENKGILELCTYGGRYGTYTGISKIVDTEIKSACNEAFVKNPNYRRAMTSW